MVPVGKQARITSGRYTGWQIVVQEDAKDTGGFFILLTNPRDKNEAYDDWVQDRDSLERHFRESGWSIDWLECP
jgi:hypothetical protein